MMVSGEELQQQTRQKLVGSRVVQEGSRGETMQTTVVVEEKSPYGQKETSIRNSIDDLDNQIKIIDDEIQRLDSERNKYFEGIIKVSPEEMRRLQVYYGSEIRGLKNKRDSLRKERKSQVEKLDQFYPRQERTYDTTVITDPDYSRLGGSSSTFGASATVLLGQAPPRMFPKEAYEIQPAIKTKIDGEEYENVTPFYVPRTKNPKETISKEINVFDMTNKTTDILVSFNPSTVTAPKPEERTDFVRDPKTINLGEESIKAIKGGNIPAGIVLAGLSFTIGAGRGSLCAIEFFSPYSIQQNKVQVPIIEPAYDFAKSVYTGEILQAAVQNPVEFSGSVVGSYAGFKTINKVYAGSGFLQKYYPTPKNVVGAVRKATETEYINQINELGGEYNPYIEYGQPYKLQDINKLPILAVGEFQYSLKGRPLIETTKKSQFALVEGTDPYSLQEIGKNQLLVPSEVNIKPSTVTEIKTGNVYSLRTIGTKVFIDKGSGNLIEYNPSDVSYRFKSAYAENKPVVQKGELTSENPVQFRVETKLTDQFGFKKPLTDSERLLVNADLDIKNFLEKVSEEKGSKRSTIKELYEKEKELPTETNKLFLIEEKTTNQFKNVVNNKIVKPSELASEKQLFEELQRQGKRINIIDETFIDNVGITGLYAGGVDLRPSGSAYRGVFMATKQNQFTVQKPTTITRPSILTSQDSGIKNAVDFKFRIDVKQTQPQEVTPQPRVKQKQDIIPDQIIETIQRQEPPNQIIVPRQEVNRFSFVRLPEPQIPEITTIKTPPRTKDSGVRRYGFESLVRKKGKFAIIGESQTVQGAVNLGRLEVERSAAASFKVREKSGREIRAFRIGSTIRPSKRNQNIFIQVPRSRISSAGEKSEITAKGRFVLGMRKKTRKIF